VVVTLPLVLLIVEEGLVHLDEPIATYIPEFAIHNKQEVTLKHLLTHTSGLTAHRSYYAENLSAEEIKAKIYNEKLEYPTGTKVVYSDLGFILLSIIVTRVLGKPLDQAANELIFQPLGMKDSQFCPAKELQPRIAATEYSEQIGRYKWGEVHDDNAYALGGVSGHAGLFSTTEDLGRFAKMWLQKGKWENQWLLSSAITQAALRNYTNSLDGNRGLGWVLKNDSFDQSGDLISLRAYGHTGFTGTSIWMDPERDLFIVLLTNRVHFGRNRPITDLRKRFHNAIISSLDTI
jgi:CubicO group peptidase (beta-lactamase class C family)